MVNKQIRRTKKEMDALRYGIYNLLRNHHPQTDRQLFYQMVSVGAIPKTEAAYKGIVVRLCGEMRERGELPWNWLTDSTRWIRKPTTYTSLEQALYYTKECYRRNLWSNQDAYVEVWCEKDALSGVLYAVTQEYDVPLMVVRGFPSKAFLHGAAVNLAAEGKPSYIYYFGDLDPSGLKIWKNIQDSIRRYEPVADITFERIAITEEQVHAYNLPTRPTKREGNPHAKDFEGDSIEVDALPVDVLQELVRDCIDQHVNEDQLQVTRTADESERAALGMFSVQVKNQQPVENSHSSRPELASPRKRMTKRQLTKCNVEMERGLFDKVFGTIGRSN